MEGNKLRLLLIFKKEDSMLIDITMKITPEIMEKSQNTDKSLAGHIGTHFDVMDKAFPLEYTERKGVVFDVSHVEEREICSGDIDMSKVRKDMFVAFCTGYSEREEYGSRKYFSEHPQLSCELIEKLLDMGISIIGVDFAGVRRGSEHTPTDARCADRGVFVVENLCSLKRILENGGSFTACTYPMNCEGLTGLPCRVIAKI